MLFWKRIMTEIFFDLLHHNVFPYIIGHKNNVRNVICLLLHCSWSARLSVVYV